MNKKLLLIPLTALMLPLSLHGADLVCSASSLSLASVNLGMKLRSVQAILGPAKLTLHAPDPAAERQTYYQWRTGAATLDIAFDGNSAVVFISYSSKTPAKPYSNVTLNADTINGIGKKLGAPTRLRSPTFQEGEYVSYSVEYRCGPNGADWVEFASGLDCNRPDMDKCLSPDLLSSRPIVQVSLKRSADSAEE